MRRLPSLLRRLTSKASYSSACPRAAREGRSFPALNADCCRGLWQGERRRKAFVKHVALGVQAPESRLQGTDDSVHKKVLAIFLIFTEYIVQDLYKISNYIIPSMAWFSSAKPPLQSGTCRQIHSGPLGIQAVWPQAHCILRLAPILGLILLQPSAACTVACIPPYSFTEITLPAGKCIRV